jgi:single stranded DNA-binding protein
VISGISGAIAIVSGYNNAGFPPIKQTLDCDSKPPRSLSCPKENGAERKVKTKCLINSVTLVGFVGSDPEQRQAKGNGSKFAVLSVATQRSWKNANDEWSSKTDWHRVVVFRPRLAQHVATTIKKGAHVLVEGSLVSSTCEQANGKGKKAKTAKITSWSIRADVVRKLDRGEPELETVASGSGVASAPARFSKLYFPLRRQGAGSNLVAPVNSLLPWAF